MKKEREKRESRIWSSETIQTNYTKSESLIFFFFNYSNKIFKFKLFKFKIKCVNPAIQTFQNFRIFGDEL